MNLYDVLARGFPADRGRPCLRLQNGTALSYGEIENGAACIARQLKQDGVAPGDRVILCSEKCPEALMIYLGALKAGAIFVPLNPDYTEAEMAYFHRDAEPKIAVADAAAYARRARDAGIEYAVVPRDAQDTAAIIYTSGTTGRPKGAMLTQCNLAANALALRDVWQFTGNDVLLHALPIFHVHGLFISLHCALLCGCETIWLPKFTEDDVLAACARATVVMGVPTYYSRLLKAPGWSAEHVQGVRLFISGSAPLAPATFASFEKRTGKRICERYGMSEAVIITSNAIDSIEDDSSVGVPLPGVELRIEGAGEVGQIEIKGPSVFKGYWRKPEETAAAFTSDGYFRTGDIGRLDSSGRVWVVSRAKDIIISGGLNVSPREVELVLEESPGVSESAVIGVPHPDFGEAVVAVVVGETDIGDLVHRARQRLAPYKVPKSVQLVDSLPRNVMGKVLKNMLRARYAGLFAQ